MAHTINVRSFIDERKFGKFQFLVAAMCALVVFLDGFDTQAIGYVAPAIIKSFQVSRASLSPVFSASLVGLMLGALLGGPVSDRFGRRPVLLAGLMFFGVMSLLTAAATSINSLLVLRLLTGLGLGCVMPNAIALTSEFSPERTRSTAVMVMFCGFSLGAALGGLVAAVLIKDFGWQSVFVVGGVLPCLAAVLLWFCLPESVSFLVVSGKRDAKIFSILSKLDPAFVDGAAIRFVADGKQSEKFPVSQLFSDKRALLTLLLWVVFFMSLMDLYFLSNWLPTIVNDAGIAVGPAVLITAMLQVGGTLGTLVLGRVFDKVSPFRALAVIYFLAAGFIVLVGTVGNSVPMLVITIFGAGFCVVGGQIGANALAAKSYPTAIRATGVGWSLGIGRIGSIIGPIAGGLLLSLQWETHEVFLIGAIPVFIAGICAFIISRFPAAKPSL
ncbi:MFS transporter [Undibacterium sp. TJN25]|uniref:MFS transporter n=1 Tax=Undibacterium sp. TJN25 TaxID=3413056 RepID=UPI003BF368E0